MYLSVKYRSVHAFVLGRALRVIMMWTNALACGCVDVQMHCVCVHTYEWRKKEEKKITYWWDGDGHAGAWACGWPCWRVDADALRVDADE